MTWADAAQATIDDTFAEFGAQANYIPPSSSSRTPCLVMDADEDRTVQFPGTSKPVGEGGKFEIRKSEIAAPTAKGIIAFVNDAGLETAWFVIAGDPVFDDQLRLVWTVRARPTSQPA